MLAFGILLSIILQFSAAIIAFTLIRRTKYNISWILITIAFLFIAIGHSINLYGLFHTESGKDFAVISNFLNITISLLIFVGVIFIKKIFDLQNRIDNLRKQTENRVLNAIIATEEKERHRFAKDIHDGLGPLLAMMKMSISALMKSEMATAENKEIISNIDTFVAESLMAIKEISNNLSPHILENFGLTSAINSFIAKITFNHAIKINVNSNKPDKRFEYNKEVVLYRVILELIANTLKHSGAGVIDITIFFSEQTLEITYKDNGKGFDTEKTFQTQTGMGFSNIFSRIKSIHGVIEVNSKNLEGINVVINVNL